MTIPEACTKRLTQLQHSLSQYQAVLLAAPADLRYFADFVTLVPNEREGFLLVTPEAVVLIKAPFAPVNEELANVILNSRAVGTADSGSMYEVREGCRPTALQNHLAELRGQLGWQVLSADFAQLHVDEYLAITSLAQSQNWQVVALDRNLIWRQRLLKDEREIAAITRASTLSQQALANVRTSLRPGMTELAVAEQLFVELLHAGVDGLAFPTIVAFGEHAALPHHQPGTTVLREDTPFLIDMGAMVNGYRSDMTRTFWFGKNPSADFVKIENLVQTAYTAGLAASHPGTTASAVDAAARQVIAQAGFGDQFIHTTGHGVGLDIHEPPSIGSADTTQLRAGMVITIEPGIYLPGKFGYRHENTILVTPAEAKVL